MTKKIFISILAFTTILFASNNLSNETSPYLLQHKDNPVNWHAWGPEAFAKAKKENKNIFLSVGYSTCHWCHVMAEESFENKEVAQALNDKYISIKMDKEQYPHIDSYYQTIYRIMNQKSGGWPLTIVLTPSKKVFFSATYMPKDDGYGQRGLLNTLALINGADTKNINESADEIMGIMDNVQNQDHKIIKISNKLETKIVNDYKNMFDFKYKGFSTNPKFPNATNITLLLKIYEITKNKDALEMATSALTAMAKGGIYDQIEGGFYRYTVDEKWMIPHFEKMLYTNAELLEAYILAYKVTKNELYKKVIVETIVQIDKRFMVNKVYQSASNADSKNLEGHNEEGFYFVYEYDEIEEYLEKNKISAKMIAENLAYFGITKAGNFETDYSNTHITSNIKKEGYQRVKDLLVKYRSKKEYPFIDNKINTAWNSMYLKSKFLAGAIDKRYAIEAKESLDALLKTLYVDNVLYHQTIIGINPTQTGLLEDYAFLGSALFEAYQSTMDKKYFNLYSQIVKESISKFYNNNKWRQSDDDFITYASIEHGGYASALSTNLINITKYASVSADVKAYDVVLRTIDKFSKIINDNATYYPYASLVVIMKKIEPVFLKSNNSNITKIDLKEVQYPFIYKSLEDTSDYLGCKMNACFSFNKDFKIVKKDIETLIETK